MRKLFVPLFLASLMIFMSGCTDSEPPKAVNTSISTEAAAPSSSVEVDPSTLPTREASEATTESTENGEIQFTMEAQSGKHSELYIEGVSVDDMLMYFNEVCLDSEYINGGDPSVVQKWTSPIYFYLHGNYSDEDYNVIYEFTDYLNGIYGFPGMYEAYDEYSANLDIYFCSKDEMTDLIGQQTNYEELDGAVNFWYDEYDRIYSGIICYRNDLDRHLKNSVILEEIYNGLGPVQDTEIREDSIIYSQYSEPQELTQIDKVILEFLYHPDVNCSMTASECEEVIRYIYY